MIGIGTIINALAIGGGAAIGLLIKNGIPERIKTTIMQAIGLAVLMIGLSGSLKEIFQVAAGGYLESRFTILMILCLVCGGIIGELLRIEERLANLGGWLQKRFSKQGGDLVRGFVTASLVYCVGAMAVVGALEDGLTGKINILLSKSLLDGISAVVFGASLGAGVALSALSVLLYQGVITLLAGTVKALLTTTVISQTSLLGGVLIMSIGLNLLEITEIKIGNLLPAIFLPVVFDLVKQLLPVF